MFRSDRLAQGVKRRERERVRVKTEVKIINLKEAGGLRKV